MPVGMGEGPGADPEAAAAAAEEGWFLRVTVGDHFLVQGLEVGEGLGAAVGFADVDAGDRDAGIEELLVHPALGFVRVGVEGGAVEDPGFS